MRDTIFKILVGKESEFQKSGQLLKDLGIFSSKRFDSLSPDVSSFKPQLIVPHWIGREVLS
jgi:hypothetical protein